MPKSVGSRLSKLRKIHPAKLILLSYLAFIGWGASVLMLPVSTASGEISFIDALFTATSAVCVTGLTVVDTGSRYSPFGQWIILILIQVGGLGVMTFSVTFFLSLGKRVPFLQRRIMQETFAYTPREDIYRLVKYIFFFTGGAELSGTILLCIFFQIEDHSFFKALYLAFFHSVSAFCNAGFSLFKANLADYYGSPLLNLTICALIILGGIGFPVAYEISERFRRRSANPSKTSIQTKTVLITTAILIFGGMLIFLWGEHNNILRKHSLSDSLLIALFQSVTARTAGFNTVDIASLNNATLALMMFLMFFGASPGSCGGGVKTTTLAVLGSFTWTRLLRRTRVNMFKKSIPQDTVARSVSLVVLSIGLIFLTFFLLLLSQQGNLTEGSEKGEFAEYLFEVVSAFGTVGLSMGATAKLNTWGKLLIIVTMLIGRVGVLTFAYVVAGAEARNGVQYAEQNLMIG